MRPEREDVRMQIKDEGLKVIKTNNCGFASNIFCKLLNMTSKAALFMLVKQHGNPAACVL